MKTRIRSIRKVFCNPRTWKRYVKKDQGEGLPLLRYVSLGNKSGKTASINQAIEYQMKSGRIILSFKGQQLFDLCKAKRLFGYTFWIV